MSDPINGSGTKDPAIDSDAEAKDFMVAGEPLEGDDLGQKILATLPGLTGAIGNAFKEQVGRNVAFVLVAFAPSGATFTTNVAKPEEMRAAMRAVSSAWDEEVAPDASEQH